MDRHESNAGSGRGTKVSMQKLWAGNRFLHRKVWKTQGVFAMPDKSEKREIDLFDVLDEAETLAGAVFAFKAMTESKQEGVAEYLSFLEGQSHVVLMMLKTLTESKQGRWVSEATGEDAPFD